MRRLLCVLAVLAAGLAVAASGAAAGPYDGYLAPESACPNADATTPDAATQATTMLCLLDYARATRGLARLAHAPLLATSAGLKADDIVRCDDFSHTACGQAWDTDLTAASYLAPGFAAEGDEILGAGTGRGASPRSIVRAWLEQDEHRATLLGTSWRDEGVALRTSTTGAKLANTTVWVAHFGWQGSPAKAAPPVAATHGSSAVDKPTTALRLVALPGRVRTGHPVRFRFVLTSLSGGVRRAVAGKTVFFASHRARTNANGQATIAMSLRRPGRYRALVSTGARRASAVVLAR